LNKRLERVATFALLACLIACIGATVYLAVSPKVGERFTEFYILGPLREGRGLESAVAESWSATLEERLWNMERGVPSFQ